MSNQVLLDKLDRTAETLSNTLVQLTKLSSLDANERGSEDHLTSSTGLANVSSFGVQMANTYTMQLIKGVQDLLVITRTIREKWVLDQMPESQDAESVDDEKTLDEYKNLIDQSMQTILQEMR